MSSALPLIHELRPAPDPWATAQRMAHLKSLVFLDSAAGPSHLSRYSYLTANPFERIVTRGLGSNPFSILAGYLQTYRAEAIPDLPPFQGGAAGLFGYDLSHHLERLPRPARDDFEISDAVLGLYDWVIAWDHHANRAWIISTGFPLTDREERQRRATKTIAEILKIVDETDARWVDRFQLTNRLRTATEAIQSTRNLGPHQESIADLPDLRPAPLFPLPGRENVFSNFDRDGYLKVVQRAIDYIHAGDCFQVNLAQRLVTPQRLSSLETYLRLREKNPSPFAAYADLGQFQIISASPELFLRVSDRGEVETRPIKGTRPRGRTEADDRANAADLLASTKDRAENVMIVDLLRNDLGRVCDFGSVRVEEVCRLETYPTVHHLVSVVRGRLPARRTALDLLQASFPGGSVTGAPKVRAMEIIAELEPHARGPYCGSLGYVSFSGAMETSILIRTMTAGRGWLQFPVGGGIVADSDPKREYEETLHKAAGMLRVLD
jgi:para-aminobenzoate synthetase component 1